MWPFRRRFAAITEIPDDQWMIGTGQNNGELLLVRINAWARSIRGHPAYPWRLGIAVPVPLEAANTVNDPESPFSQLEDRALHILQAGCESILLVVLFGFASDVDGRPFREWVFCTRDPEWARAQAEALCTEFRHLRAAHTLEHDPKWVLFRRFGPR